LPHAGEISAAHGAELLRLGHRLDPAGDHFGRRNHRHRAVAGNDRADADQGLAEPGHVSRRVFPDVPRLPDRDRRADLRPRFGLPRSAHPACWREHEMSTPLPPPGAPMEHYVSTAPFDPSSVETMTAEQARVYQA